MQDGIAWGALITAMATAVVQILAEMRRSRREAAALKAASEHAEVRTDGERADVEADKIETAADQWRKYAQERDRRHAKDLLVRDKRIEALEQHRDECEDRMRYFEQILARNNLLPADDPGAPGAHRE